MSKSYNPVKNRPFTVVNIEQPLCKKCCGTGHYFAPVYGGKAKETNTSCMECGGTGYKPLSKSESKLAAIQRIMSTSDYDAFQKENLINKILEEK